MMSNLINSQQLRELIRILERKLGVLGDNQVPCCNITMAQCHALVEIGRAEKISLNKLASILNLENSTMSRTVNNLVKNNLVKREIDEKDRRYITISLTENGKAVFENIELRMNEFFRTIYSSITEDKREQVLESLQILIQAVNNS